LSTLLVRKTPSRDEACFKADFAARSAGRTGRRARETSVRSEWDSLDGKDESALQIGGKVDVKNVSRKPQNMR
jgi:hypothetical protein